MGQPTNNDSVNWWAIAHTLAIFGQLSLCIVGTIAFAFYQPSNLESHIPSDDEFWGNISVRTTIPWVSAASGGITTIVNIVLFIALWKTYSPDKKRRFMSRSDRFRRAVVVGTGVFSLVFAANIILAVKSGLGGRTDVCATASIGSVLTVIAVCADYIQLRKLQNEKQDSYVAELARTSSGESAPTTEAPPPYEP